MSGVGNKPLNQPRQNLYNLTSPFKERGRYLVISNIYLAESIEKPTFHEFLRQFADNANCQKVLIGAANDDEAKDMCCIGKINRGLTLERKGESLGQLSVRPYLMEVKYKGKDKEERVKFVHGKMYVCFDTNGNELWAIIGGANFSCSAWGNDWPIKFYKNAADRAIQTSQPNNLEVSVFLSNETDNRLRDILRVQPYFSIDSHEYNRGLGWTLTLEGLASICEKENRKRKICDIVDLTDDT